MKKVLWIVILSVMMTVVNAEDQNFYLDINIGSKHSNSDNGTEGKYNEDNFGLGLSLDLSDSYEFNGGFFKNSYSKTSAYIGLTYKIAEYQPWNGFYVEPVVAMLIVTGYANTELDQAILPGLIPSIRFGTETYKADLGMSTDGNNAIIILRLKYTIPNRK